MTMSGRAWTWLGVGFPAAVGVLVAGFGWGPGNRPEGPPKAQATPSSLPAARSSPTPVPPEAARPTVADAAAPAPVAVAPARAWRNDLGMEFVRIEPGEFTMGTTPEQVDLIRKRFPDTEPADYEAELPAHRVRITKPFDMGTYAVTIGQFKRFAAETHNPADANEDHRIGARPRPWFPQADDHPMVNVSWNDARGFCSWLTGREGGKVRYRLPTEAEWEYACRAGTTTLFPNGDDPEMLACIGNVADATARKRYPSWRWTIAADDGQLYTAPVGGYAPNAWGLFDMIGNVWEWCEDGFDPGYYRTLPPAVADPTGAAKSGTRAVRGGCWYIHPRRDRPADRGGFEPTFHCGFLGFRVVAERAA
jgi:formylglycine-generating enzyme required for sulfatase activity